MDDSLLGLRRQLAVNLERLLGDSRVEEKELAAFDLMVSRRGFLQAAQAGAVGALVQSQLVPTAWGRTSPALAVSPRAVGLTRAEQAGVQLATQLIGGTELFKDTLYARPLIAQDAPHSHALIEGIRGRLRVQSQLGAASPAEAAFLDTGYHFGPPELLQLEQDSSGNWELVHYYHQLHARTDGARTDSLARQVIVAADGTLVNPTKVYCVTGANTNRFVTVDGKLTNNASYVVYVECDGGKAECYVMVGTATLTLAGTATTTSGYPIRWAGHHSSSINLPYGTSYLSTDKYCASAMSDAGTYSPNNATQHIVIRTTSAIHCVTVSDADPANITLLITQYTITNSTVSVAHIEWTDAMTSDGIAPPPAWAVLARSDAGALFSSSSGALTVAHDDHPFNNATNIRRIVYHGPGMENESNTGLRGSSIAVPDFSKLQDVHDLYSVRPTNPGSSTPDEALQLKLVNFDQSWGLSLLVLWRNSSDNSSQILGCYPLQLPDLAGVGEILSLGGGTSKFGGMRYYALDANGNGFLLRQPRMQGSSTPYTPPIHGRYDDQGNPTVYDGTAPAKPVPAGTDASSHLWHLLDYTTLAGPEAILNNILMDAVLGFQTDATNASQGIWLGNGYSAIHGPTRCGHDSQHFAVREVASSDGDTYAVYSVFNDIVTKTWRSRQIATQTLPTAPEEKLSGEFYQATLTPANAYGQPVQLGQGDNQNLQIEVRADSPCTVIDEGTNLYWDVDRYSSFITTCDPSTGKLKLASQADVLSQVIYARLVDVTGLSPSSSDPAMVTGSSDDGSAWLTINLAADAQARMGNSTDSTPAASNPAEGGTPDTNVYVDTDALRQSQINGGWVTKGNYKPTDANLGSLATYMNQSAQNLSSATGTLTDSGPGGSDPLTALTVMPAASTPQTPLTTTFAYDSGAVTTTNSVPSSTGPHELGSLWSSISHALHDALHWLQNVEGNAYDDLKDGVTVVIDETSTISVAISADIMKAVNGVDSALNQVVSTVEEYASVILNVIVTIIESSWMFQFIEDLIELISLFLHFKDILALHSSFKQTFAGMFPATPSGPILPVGDVDIQSALAPLIGPGNTTSASLNGVDTDNVVDAAVQTLFDAVFANPLTTKILGAVLQVVTRVVNEVQPNLPLSFHMSSSATADIAAEFDKLTGELEGAVVNMTEDALNFLVNQLIGDIADPKATFGNFSKGIGPLMEQLASDAMQPFFDLFQDLLTNDMTFVQDAMTGGDYLELDFGVIADLFSLFGIGSSSGSTVKIGPADAIFFPLSVAVWLASFKSTGKSVSSIGDLTKNLTLSQGELGSVNVSLLELVTTIASGTMMEINHGIWIYNQLTNSVSKQSGAGASSSWKELFKHLGAWVNAIQWLGQLTVTFVKIGEGVQDTPWDLINKMIRATTSVVGVYLTIPGANNDPGAGLPDDAKPSDVIEFFNFLCTIGNICIGTEVAVTTTPDMSSDQVLTLVGKDIYQVPTLIRFLFRAIMSTEEDPDVVYNSMIPTALVILACTMAGTELQVLAMKDEF